RRRTTNSARNANGVVVSATASPASPITIVRFMAACWQGCPAVCVGQAFAANVTSSRAVRTASRTSAATIVRCRPVTGSPYGVGADLAERTEATAICSGRRLELTGANPVGDGNDLGLGPFEATITGIAATDEPGLEEMQRQLIRGLPVLPLPRERVDAELERLARPTGGGARIAPITRLV